MKTTTKILILILFYSSVNWACKKRDNTVQTATVQVKVQYPNNYSEQNVANAEVKLTSKSIGSVFSAFTNSTGLAVFQDVVPGTYDVSVSKALTAADAQNLTGISQALTLNASKTDVLVDRNAIRISSRKPFD